MYLLKHHPELATVWDELDNSTSQEPEPIEQPVELKLPLLSFQLTGVGWMCKQEELNDVSLLFLSRSWTHFILFI